MLGLILEFRNEAQTLFAWCLCLAALVWGGGPERAIALVWLVLFEGIQGAYVLFWGGEIKPDDLSIFYAVIDAAAAFALIAIALQANRIYPLWVAALQILATLAHISRELVDQISPLSYVVMAFAPGYFQLILLAAGLITHIRRVNRHGTYRDWRIVAPLQIVATNQNRAN